MIFTLHRLFTRKGFEGYSAFHHYSDVAISAVAATTLAIKALSEGDPVSAKDAFETAAYLGSAVGAAASWRTALLSEPSKSRAGLFTAKFFAGTALAVALSSGLSTVAADAHEVQAMRMAAQWHQMAAKQPSALADCGARVSGPSRVYLVLKCEKIPFPQTIAL
ncbi:hypothetical protein [Micavibrio aeruginosavorus]|uniref:hypothetical protein n=1 Tax=Micavibrio aeruginosavorus TaxID=349221 RepID=UPI003F4AF755